MIKNIRLSLSSINTIFLLIFLITIIIGISLSTYFSTKKILEYNINEYLKQTENITNIIITSELSNLDSIALEVSEIIENSDKNFENRINIISSIDQIDLLFLKTDNKIVDYSNSLFDTQNIIKELRKIDIPFDNVIISIEVSEENYILFLSRKNILDKNTGRIKSKLFTGKILNDNFSVLNEIKSKASIEDIYIYFDNKPIASTSHKELSEFSLTTDELIIKRKNLLYLKSTLVTFDKKDIEIIFVVKNSTFELLEEDFTKIVKYLLLFIFLSSLLLYVSSKKFIINPFSNLLNYAKNIKDDKNKIYRPSYIKEFNDFAYDLKSIIDELRDLKEKYSKAIDGVEDGLWDLNFRTKKVFYSKRFLEMIGFNEEDKIYSIDFWKKNIHKNDYKKTLKKLIKHKNGETSFYEDNYRFLCKNGSYKWIKIRGRIFYDEFNNPLEMMGFHTDINEFINLQNDNSKKEQMIYQQSKLASMGEMIGNIAHQWRQPLNVISTIASNQILQIELGVANKKDTIEDLEKLNDTVQYLSTIIDKFRYFFNPNKELEKFSVKDTINENIEIFEASYSSSGIELIIELDNIEILGYKFELMQVIINLINNSKDALLSKLDMEEKKIIFIECIKEGNFLFIKVYDNANGINKKINEKIYEPYFTTKDKSEGTGLGLYMSQEIISKHFKGEISNKTIKFTYKNVEYIGEEFKIKIPL